MLKKIVAISLALLIGLSNLAVIPIQAAGVENDYLTVEESLVDENSANELPSSGPVNIGDRTESESVPESTPAESEQPPVPEATEKPAETENPVATEISAETEKPQDETSSQVTENPSEEQQIAELFVIEKLFKDRENKNFVADFNSLLPEGKKFAEEQLTNLKETDNLEAFKTLFVSTLQTEGNPADTAFEPLFAMTDENEFKTFLQKLLEENRLLESPDAEIVDGTANTDNTELIHGNTDVVVVDSMTIRKTGEASDNAAIGASGDTELMVSVEMSNIQKEAEIAFRFTIPTRSLKDGYLNVVASRYAWLQDAKLVKQNGNYILTGWVKVNSEGSVATYKNTLVIGSKALANQEELPIQAECWPKGQEETQKKQDTLTLRVDAECKYELDLYGKQDISGWFNESTKEFSVVKPENPDGFKFGRIYTVREFMMHHPDSAQPDLTKPLNFEFSYEVYDRNKKSGKETLITDLAFQPILLAVKQGGKQYTDSQLEGTGITNDVTMGGHVKDDSSGNGPHNEGLREDGTYTFSRSEADPHTIQISVSLERIKDNPTYTGASAHIWASFFVPAQFEENKDVERILKVTPKNPSATADSQEPSATKIYKHEPFKVFPYDPELPHFERVFWETRDVVYPGEKLGIEYCLSLIGDRAYRASDYNINAINVLVKVESGLTPYTADWNSGVGGQARVEYKYSKVLFATKPDGSAWKDEDEINDTHDTDLIYYDALDKVPTGHTVVGCLLELRDGIWKSGWNLRNGCSFQVDDNFAGKSAIIVKDIKIWCRQDYKDRWSGTNGDRYSQSREPEICFYPGTPNLNGKDREDGGKYIRSEWPKDQSKPQYKDVRMGGNFPHGWTMFGVGGKFEIDRKNSKCLNGADGDRYWFAGENLPTAVFDISNSERTVDKVFVFHVTGVGNQEIHFKLDLTSYEMKDNHSVNQHTGLAYLSTEGPDKVYQKGDTPGSRGQFVGAQAIDPEHFTVPGDGTYYIYYSETIGDPTNFTKDAKTGVCVTKTSLEQLPESNHYVRPVGWPTTRYAVNVTRSEQKSLDKVTSSPVTKQTPNYTLVFTSRQTGEKDFFMMDVLPYDHDSRGSKFANSFTIPDPVTLKYNVQENGTVNSDCKIFYTTDEQVRQKSVEMFASKQKQNADFECDGIQWKLAENGVIPEGTSPTALLVSGDVGKDEQVVLNFQLKLSDAQPEDHLVNNAYALLKGSPNKILTSLPVSVTVLGRSLSGKAFVDANENGILDAQDTMLSGVKVKLYQKDGTEITNSATGKLYDVTTDENGAYTFECVPENKDGYYVRFEHDLTNYVGMEQSKNPLLSVLDNDAVIGSESKFAETTSFKMYTDDELISRGIAKQEAKGVNLGVKNRSYDVTYIFESGTPDQKLPEEVMSLCPTDSSKYQLGDTVMAIQPEQTEVRTQEGIWKFVGYDKDSQIVNGNITFTGKWEFDGFGIGPALPRTGSIGTTRLTALGVMLVIGGMCLGFRKRKKD